MTFDTLKKICKKLSFSDIEVKEIMVMNDPWRIKSFVMAALASSVDSLLSRLEETVEEKYKQTSLLQMPMVGLDKTSLEYGFTDGLRWVRAEIQALKQKGGKEG